MGKLKKITTIVGAIEIAIGAALAFSGVATGLGLALIAGGVTTTAANLNWDALPDNVKSTYEKIKSYLPFVGIGMVAFGAILAFSGAAVGTGIGLMIGGISTTAASTDWELLGNKIKGVYDSIKEYLPMVGVGLVVLGAILSFSGAATGIGLGLIAAGVGTVAVTTDWNYLYNQVKSTYDKIKGYLPFVGVGLAILGIILLMTGAAAPIGIAAIIAGIGITAVSIDWNYLGNKLKEAWSNIESWYNKSVAPWFTAEKWKGLAQKAIDGLLAPFKNIQWPHISTPHISWKPGGWEASGWIKDVLSALNLPTTLPKLSVEWYAKGGVFTAPTIAGIGEAGPEAVLPLNQDTYHSIAEGIAENGGGNYDTEKIISALESLKQAILNRPIKLYADNREIARAANAGNQSINRRYRTVARN